jgi:hypothetical protein
MKRNMPVRIIATLLVLTSTALAKKADWPGGNGVGVIGFALVELTPKTKDGASQPTTFTFNYLIPEKYALNAPNGQIILLHCSAFEKFNNIPESEFLAHEVNKDKLAAHDVRVSAKLTIKKPGLYVVAYGPWDGLLTFDEAEARETYKISADAPEGAKLRWVDQDAGDVTVAKMRETPGSAPKLVVRVRMIRAGLQSLTAESNFLIEKLKLHPTAAERVALLQANW